MSEFYLLPTTGFDSGHNQKNVKDATLDVEDSPAHPRAERQVVDVHTRDGWTYRFQRWDWDEPLVLLDRVRPDGSVVTRNTNLPQNVEEFVAEVGQGEIEPTTAPRNDAYGLAATDGGDVRMEDCPHCGRRAYLVDESGEEDVYHCSNGHEWRADAGSRSEETGRLL